MHKIENITVECFAARKYIIFMINHHKVLIIARLCKEAKAPRVGRLYILAFTYY